MANKVTPLSELYRMLKQEKELLHLSPSEALSKQCKTNIRLLQSRIANRERYDALRSMGLKKTPFGWE